MMRTAVAVAVLAGAALGSVPAIAEAATVPVSVEFQAFAPSQVDVLPGEAVEWTNVSERLHTVTAGDGSFDSGDLFSGERFARTFDRVGAYTYQCTIHLGMTGAVEVRRVVLNPLPPAAIPAGQPVEFSGRTADPGPVMIEQDSGSGFRRVAGASAEADGSWHVQVRAVVTSEYRAVSGAGVSEARRLLVTDRHIRIRATRRGVRVTVDPGAPGARVRLQRRLRERFGWWPSPPRRLDYVSRAEFVVHRPGRVRAILVDVDGWTPLATSPVLKLPAGRRR